MDEVGVLVPGLPIYIYMNRWKDIFRYIVGRLDVLDCGYARWAGDPRFVVVWRDAWESSLSLDSCSPSGLLSVFWPVSLRLCL